MGCIYITSDLHLGHKNIAKYREYVSSVEENTRLITSEWRQRVKKRDIVYVLGDAAFNKEELYNLASLPGQKILLRGNHDNYLSTDELRNVFDEIEGALKKWRMWLTHIPIHPAELRGGVNIHGHVHLATIPDKRYMNVCCDNLYTKTGSNFITLQRVREIFDSGRIL